jgi:acylphosphatase
VTTLVHWHCVAHGRVQGVGYRARVVDCPRRHGVVGRVANQADGTVFINFQGDLASVEAFLRDASGLHGASHALAVLRVAERAVSADLTAFQIACE